jgi:hypothetical protein
LALRDAPPDPQGPSAQWLREIGAEPYWVTEYGRAADLLVIGRPGEDEGVSLDTIEAALIDSGRPLLILPAAPLTAIPETVAIAWKATPQAARALTAALPFVSKAKQIVVLTVAENQRKPEERRIAWWSVCAGMACRFLFVIFGRTHKRRQHVAVGRRRAAHC